MHYFDSYPIRSNIRKIHPAYKLSIFFIYTVLVLCSQSVLFLGVVLITYLFSTVFSAKITIYRLLRLMFLPVGFILLGAMSVLVQLNPMHSVYSLHFGGLILGVSHQSIQQVVLLLFRSFASIAILYNLVLNTPITDIIYVLRKVRVPEVILDLMVLVYRNIFILSDTAQSIYVSQKSRLGFRNFKTTLKSTGLMAGSVFVLSGMRAEQMYRSMESRGYNGKLNTLPAEWKMNKSFFWSTVSLLIVNLFLFVVL